MPLMRSWEALWVSRRVAMTCLMLWEARHQLLAHRDEAVLRPFRRPDAEQVLRVALGAHDQVAAGHQLGHHVLGALAVLPQVAAVVHVGRDGEAQAAGGGNGLAGGLGGRGRNGGRNARPVQPLGILQNLVPGKPRGLQVGEGRVVAVVHDAAGPQRGAHFEEVQAQPLAPEHAVLHVHAVAPEVLGGGLAHGVIGEAAHVRGRHAQMGQGRPHVGVAPAVGHVQRAGLRHPVVERRRQPHHDFTKGDDLFHGGNLRAGGLESWRVRTSAPLLR